MRLLTASLLTLAACTAPSGPSVSLDIDEPNHLAGAYERDGVVLGFDFARTGDKVVFKFDDGTHPLIETTVDGAWQTSSLLDGRLVISGLANAPNPRIEGDLSAQAELEVSSHGELLESIADALVEAGTDPERFTPDPQVVGAFDIGGGYFEMFPNERMVFLSAAGPSPTYLYLWNLGAGCLPVSVNPWPQPSEMFAVSGWSQRVRYWWGAAFTVTNYPAYANFGGQICAPGKLRIKVSPYWP